jgi:branched-chain amino acid transport system ATP-binding protein
VTLLEVDEITLRFGRVAALDGVSFVATRGEFLAIIGPNGAGKSSIFNVLSRVHRPSSGAVRLAGEDLLALPARALASRGVARSFQNLGLFAHLSALENVLVGRHHLMRAGVLSGGVLLGRARREERSHRAAALGALAFVDAEPYAGTPVAMLPYGVQKRVELARCLAMEPQLLLLDEPVAGMDHGERAEITELIRRLHAERDLTVVLVEHDMGMVMRVAERVVVLDFGHVMAAGTPAEVQADERVIRAYLGEPVEVTS